jgi:hypothetical protein
MLASPLAAVPPPADVSGPPVAKRQKGGSSSRKGQVARRPPTKTAQKRKRSTTVLATSIQNYVPLVLDLGTVYFHNLNNTGTVPVPVPVPDLSVRRMWECKDCLLHVAAGLWIRIRIGSGFNGVSGSGFAIRIQGQEKEENEKKIQTFKLKFL